MGHLATASESHSPENRLYLVDNVVAAGNFFGGRSLLIAEIREMTLWDSAEHSAGSQHSHPWLAELLFALDQRLRRGQAVFEYSQAPSCIFRLEIARAQRTLVLHDGPDVREGERIARLHFWNEHVPPVPRDGATIGWAHRMQQAIAEALRELARFLASRPDLGDIAVICADVPNATASQREKLARIMAHYGFEAILEREYLPIAERLRRFGENILISLIVFARNAAALRTDTLARVRLPIFLSRRTLMQRFGGAQLQ